MRELINEMLKKEKKWRYIFLIATIAAPILFVVAVSTEAGFLAFLSMVVWLVVAIMYLTCATRRKNYNWFLKISNDADRVVDSINIDKSNYSEVNQIYLGGRGLFYNYAFLLIPYSEIAWVYLQGGKVKYSNVASISTGIGMKNGKQFTLRCNGEQLMIVMQKYFPDVLLGYTKENAKRYKEIARN